MGLLDDLKPETKIAPCKIRTIAETLEPSDKKIFIEAVEGETWGVSTLSKALKPKGISLSGVPISAHRSKGCSCFREN